MHLEKVLKHLQLLPAYTLPLNKILGYIILYCGSLVLVSKLFIAIL